jgi:hypothetical protein
MIVFQGINVLNSRGDPSAFSRAKEKIKNILIGLGVLLLSYVLLMTINPGIFNLDFELGEFEGFSGFNYEPPAKELNIYTFEEIPIGTIIEELLAGVSSVVTPCYKYDTSGNIVDQNGDDEIDERDILLNKDIFYCIGLLTDAYTAKVENHLRPLIEELDNLMEECRCDRCYTGRYAGAPKNNHYGEEGTNTSECC